MTNDADTTQVNALRREVKSLELQLLAAQSGSGSGVTNSYRRGQPSAMAMLSEAGVNVVESEDNDEAEKPAQQQVRPAASDGTTEEPEAEPAATGSASPATPHRRRPAQARPLGRPGTAPGPPCSCSAPG